MNELRVEKIANLFEGKEDVNEDEDDEVLLS